MAFSKKIRKLINNPKRFFNDALLNRQKNKTLKEVSLSRVSNARKNTKPSIEIYNELVNFSSNYPVNSLLYKGEYVWPYVRHHLLVQLTAVSIGKNNFKNTNPFLLQLGDPGGLKYEKCLELSGNYDFKFLEDIEVDGKGVDFLFFTAINASEQVVLDDKIYYRITDPVYEAALNVGSALKIELIRNNSPAIAKVNSYLHKATHIFSPRIYKSGYSGFVSIDSDFNKFSKKFLSSLDFNDERMRDIIDWELNTRDFYLDLLRKFKPSVIFVSSFHYNAPLISAAKFLGIKSVDLQHGIQVGYNPLYNNWQEMPKTGYQALPDLFFVWGDKEFVNIKNVFKGNAHQPVVTGNPYFWKLVDKKENFSNKLHEKLKERRINILLTMQSQTEVPSLFKEVINSTDENVMWFIRHHPKGKRFSSSEFSSDVDRVFMSDEVDSVPVIDLLKNMKLTFSEGSTVAVEGDALGVAAFITSSTGYENYKYEIDEKKFFYITDVSSFNDSFALISEQDEKISRLNPFPKVDLSEILKSIK